MATGHTIKMIQSINSEYAQVELNEIGVSDKNQLPEALQKLLIESSEGLDDQQQHSLEKLLLEFKGIFADTDGQLGRTGLVKHKIDTGDAVPIKQPPRRVPIHLRDEVEKVMQEMKDKDVIEPCCSPWASPVVLVRKKDGSICFCVDYRKINSVSHIPFLELIRP